MLRGSSLLTLALCATLGCGPRDPLPAIIAQVLSPRDAGATGACEGATRVPFAGGSGTAAEPFRVCTPIQLAAIGQAPDRLEANYALDADLHMAELAGPFAPIGGATPFSGSFDGRGHSILALRVERSDVGPAGLFGQLSGARISDLVLERVQVTSSSSQVGALAGRAWGSEIERCHVRGSASAPYGIQATGDGVSAIGGLIGQVESGGESCLLRDVSSDAMVNAPDASGNVGGLVGDIDHCNVHRAWAAGAVAAPVGSQVGGLIGRCYGANEQRSVIAAQEVYARGDVTGGSSVGGLVGAAHGNCHLQEAYGRGAVQAGGQVGGLMGFQNTLPYLTRIYALSPVPVAPDAGGLVGMAMKVEKITSGLWSSEVSPGLAGLGNTTSDEVEDLPLSAFRLSATFTARGWDLDAIWRLDPAVNDGYPSFAWQSP